MRTLRHIRFAIIILAAAAFVMVGCSKDEDNNNSSSNGNSSTQTDKGIVGTSWSGSRDDGARITITFKTSSTGIAVIREDGESYDFDFTYTYNAPNGTMVIDGDTTPFVINENTLTLANTGYVLYRN